MVDLNSVLASIAKAIVDKPESVTVNELENTETELVLELKVAPEDMGKVIGKNGRIAKAIRMLMKAASSSGNRKVIVKIR